MFAYKSVNIAIILRGGCSHNCPDSDSVNEDVSFLQYILSTIGEIIIDQESSSPVLRGVDMYCYCEQR